MSYTPTTWTTGDTITASALNKIENGIANAGGGGYDAEVYIYHSASTADDYDITIISGTFADLAARIADNDVPVVLFRIWDDMNGIRIVALGFLYSSDIVSSSPSLCFHAIQTYNTNGDANALSYITWDANDTITL